MNATFLELGSEIFSDLDVWEKFSTPNVLIDPIVRTGAYFVTNKPCFVRLEVRAADFFWFNI